MSIEVARHLHQTGRSHALASDLLYQAACKEGLKRKPDNPELFAFNGLYSLSIHYLIGLGLELMLKAAIAASGGPSDDRSLRDLGHELGRLLTRAKEVGFHSEAPRLDEVISHMAEPYKLHYFRYERPEQFLLPNFTQMIEAIEVLDRELEMLCQYPFSRNPKP